MVFMRKSAPAGDGVYAFKTPKNHRILWKSPDEAQSGPRSRERLATCGTGNTRPACAAPGTSSSQDSRRIPALRPFREPDSAEYRDNQQPKERGIRCNQRRAQLSVVPSARQGPRPAAAVLDVCGLVRTRPPARSAPPPARRARQAARNPPNQPARTGRRYWPPRRSNRRSKNNALNTPTTIRTRANLHCAHTPLTPPYNRLTAACVSSIEAISPGCASGGSGGISGTTHCGCPPARE